MSPLAIDLFCGLGGWTEGLLAEGYRVVGFDNERHVYGEARYPAQLVIQDVLTIHGRKFKDAALIVASPPCQEFSYMAMPWTIAKQKAREYRDGTRDVKQLTALFDACFRIQREACEAAGRHIPLVVENVCGAQKWVGRAQWHFGSFYLWGDVPALMPIVRRHVKVGGLDWKPPDDPRHRKGQAFNPAAQGRSVREDRATKNDGGSWFNVAHNTTSGHGRNPDGRKHRSFEPYSASGVMDNRGRFVDPDSPVALVTVDDITQAVKNGGDWFGGGSDCSLQRRAGSKSTARKAASAHIAKIPLPLSRHIARAWYPQEQQA